jgi:tRNA (guanine-N7-)-methyltransferase
MIEENISKKRKERSGESKGISIRSGNISLLASSNVTNKHNVHIPRVPPNPVEAVSSSGTLINSVTLMPLKKYFRTRAHCNPLSHNDGFKYPLSPSEAGWDLHYPNIDESNRIVRHVDVGMGFGGLTIALATLFPDKLVLGMEIRSKVCEYVRLRIEALRFEKNETGGYQNAACLRTNCMRYLPNFFNKGQLEKIFFCFPDPHFKAKNHRRRIVSTILLSEYAHFLAPNGKLYTVTGNINLFNYLV